MRRLLAVVAVVLFLPATALAQASGLSETESSGADVLGLNDTTAGSGAGSSGQDVGDAGTGTEAMALPQPVPTIAGLGMSPVPVADNAAQPTFAGGGWREPVSRARRGMRGAKIHPHSSPGASPRRSSQDRVGRSSRGHGPGRTAPLPKGLARASQSDCQLAGTALSPQCQVELGDCRIVGSEGEDTLVGTPGSDVICGREGNDTIDGREGDDIVLGGPGDDILLGGPGADCIVGGPGEDRLLDAEDSDAVEEEEGPSIDGRANQCQPPPPPGSPPLPDDDSEDDDPDDGGGEFGEGEGPGRVGPVGGPGRGVGLRPVSGPAGAGVFFISASRFLERNRPARPSRPFVSVITRSVELRRDTVRVLLFCSRSVSGRVTLLMPQRSDRRPRKLGVGGFACAARDTTVVRIRLSSAGVELVQRLGRLRLRPTVVTRDTSGQRQTLRTRLVVTAPDGG